MANSKNIPEYKVCDNPHGIMFFGPGGMDGGANMQCCTALANGNIDFHTNDGNRSVIVNGKYNEIIKGKIPNDQRKGSEKENVARSIVVEDGDLALIAENGNIKIAAKNIFIETIGDGHDGSFMVNANEAIQMVAGEQMTLGGGKVCITSADSITLNATGYIYNLAKDVKKGSPLSGGILGIFLGPVQDLLEGMITGCK